MSPGFYQYTKRVKTKRQETRVRCRCGSWLGEWEAGPKFNKGNMSLLSFYESNVHFFQLTKLQVCYLLIFYNHNSFNHLYGVSSCSKQSVSVSHSLTENPIIVLKQNSNLHSLSSSSNQSQFAISSFYYYIGFNNLCSLFLYQPITACLTVELL